MAIRSPISALDYGNEDRVQYTYDDKGRVLSATYEDGDTVRYAYDNSGTLATVSDSASGIKATYGYDYVGRLSVYKEQGGDNSLTLDYSYYVSNKQLKTLREVINGHVRGASYIYDDDTRLTSYQKANGKRAYTYDGFDRVSGYTTTYKNTGGTFGTVLTTGFTYASSAVSTTSGRVATMRQTATGLDTTYSYTYDANGNILSVSDGTNTTSYVYDSANQLVRENNQAGGFTHIWVYDNAGNIQSRSEYAYTTGTIGEALDTVVYNYGDSQWGDLLTGYDGRNITSDAIGNMLSDGVRSYTWEHGRQLATVTQNGVTWQNTYNADGLRTKRTDGTNTYEYVYYGGLLQYMEYNGQAVYFTHAPDGTPMGMLTEGNAYFYITNLQDDVVGILNSSGQVVVQYTYDAWGNPLSCTGTLATTIGTLNPLRYRGYVYDTETGLYYLQSRYYDPEIGRFLNADVFASTGQGFTGNNMFAYCGNNPVGYEDASGGMRKPCTVAINDDGILGQKHFGTTNSADAVAYGNRSKNAAIREVVDNDASLIAVVSNDAEQIIEDTNIASIYKGKLVVKVPGSSSFSFGIIFMGRKGNEDLLKHEYGHTLQLEELGLIDYCNYVVVPSVLCYWGTEFEILPKENYFSYPWEYQADQYGKSLHKYQYWAAGLASLYWELVS